MAQEIQQLVDQRIIPGFGLVDGNLGQIVAQDILGVDRVHARGPALVAVAITAQTHMVMIEPTVEAIEIFSVQGGQIVIGVAEQGEQLGLGCWVGQIFVRQSGQG